MPRFVLLLHDRPAGPHRTTNVQDREKLHNLSEPPGVGCGFPSHYDLMFEQGSVLATWSLPRPPDPGHEITADRLPDHRVDYLDYEGPISGDRGSVTQWDRGTYRVVRQTDSQWVVVLSGEKLTGRLELDRLPDQLDQPDQPGQLGQPDRWQVRFAQET